MKRFVAIAGVLLLVALAIVVAKSCSSSGDDSTPTPEETTAESVETPTGAATTAASAAPATSPTSDAAGLKLDAPLAWAQGSRRDVGCLLEQAGYKDPVWNCDSDEQPLSDPCSDMEGYYRGPQLPQEYAAKISPLLESVNLHWERRRLQEIDLIFKKGVEEDQILDAFSLPRTLKSGLANVSSIDLQDCVPGAHCLVVQGFEPGDVNCGDGRQPD